MAWIEEALDTLAAQPDCGYQPGAKPATEPSTLAALALVGHGRMEAARPVAEFLTGIQASDGSLGVRATEDTPRWPTSLALLAWLALDATRYRDQIKLATNWALSHEGERLSGQGHSGHNSFLAAWPWVDGTHSWVEPSALFVIALKAHGLWQHARTREAVEMLVDRLLPGGGSNYGNTVVLGQLLRPHVQPSGVAMVALAGEADSPSRIAKTLDYLNDAVTSETTASSLAWAVLGLAAQGRVAPKTDQALAAAYERVKSRDNSPHKIALLALAALGDRSPPITLPLAGKHASK